MMLSGFARHFRTVFPEYVGGRIVVALSGGADSVALLHLLHDQELGLELHAVHVHHGVRGAEADEDAEFCRQLCDELSVPFHIKRMVPPESPPEGREAAWRRLRYALLREAATGLEARAVATGHQRDDVAEGVLVQLLRGAGPRALAGISAGSGGWIIRPLLPWGRREILQWLAERDLDWREDSSNRRPEHLRNRVRSEVLPALAAVEPRIGDHLVTLAGDLARDEAHFAARLRELGLWLDPWDYEGGVPVEALEALDPSLLHRWLHAQVARAGLGKATRRQGELLQGLVHLGRPRAVTLAGRWRLYRARGRLWLEPPVAPAAYAEEIRRGTTAHLTIPGWSVGVVAEGGERASQGRILWRQRVPAMPVLGVRSPLPGDTIRSGSGGRRLTSLLARRVPRHLRPVWPVIHGGATIVWVPGVWTATAEGAGFVVELEVRRQ